MVELKIIPETLLNTLVISVLAISIVANGVQLFSRDNLNVSQMSKIAYAHSAKHCIDEVAKKQKLEIDCGVLDMATPKPSAGGLMDRAFFETGGYIKSSDGDPIWSNAIEMDSQGNVLRSNITRYDIATRTFTSETLELSY